MVSAGTTSGQTRRLGFSTKSFWIGIVIVSLITVGLAVVWVTMTTSRDLLVTVLALVGFAGVYPLAYVAFLGFGADAKRQRLRDDFQLFGLVSKEDLDETIDKLYRNVYSWPQFAVYIGLIVAVTVLILAGYFDRNNLGFVSASVVEMMFYGYLGAYIYSVQELVRRYNTFDLQPQVYSSILVRILVALVLTFVLSSVAGLDSVLIDGEGAGAESSPQTWLALVAFAIGVFPSEGVRMLLHQANRVINPPSHPGNELPLRNVLGISTWHESRLTMMGIDDAQNLATADIPKLLLTTQFDTQQVANWIDQSILYVKVGNKIDRFREAKITTFHEFQRAMDRFSAGASVNSSADEQVASQSNLATVLGLTDPDELRRLREYSNFPNYMHIANYYEGAPRVGSQRAEESVQKLMGAGVLDRAWSRTLREPEQEEELREEAQKLERQLQGRPNDPVLYTRLGMVRYRLGQQDEALAHFDQALRKDRMFAEALFGHSAVDLDRRNYAQAIEDLTQAIKINPAYTEAYNQRAEAFMQLGYYERAIRDLDKALEFDLSLAVAYYNRGVAYNAQGRVDEALREFEKAQLLGYDQAGLWVVWGIALLDGGQYEEAIDKLSKAIVRNSRLAEAYANRGKAYFELSKEYFDQARIDFREALRLDSSLWGTYNDLGNLEFKEGNFREAIPHYEEAIKARKEAAERRGEHPEYFLARYNLAITYHNLREADRAVEHFQHLNQLAQATTLDADQQEKLDFLANLLNLSDSVLEQLQETLQLNRALEKRDGAALSLKHIGSFHRQRGEMALASEYLNRAVEVYTQLGDEAKADEARLELEQVRSVLSQNGQG